MNAKYQVVCHLILGFLFDRYINTDEVLTDFNSTLLKKYANSIFFFFKCGNSILNFNFFSSMEFLLDFFHQAFFMRNNLSVFGFLPGENISLKIIKNLWKSVWKLLKFYEFIVHFIIFSESQTFLWIKTILHLSKNIFFLSISLKIYWESLKICLKNSEFFPIMSEFLYKLLVFSPNLENLWLSKVILLLYFYMIF